MSKIVLPPVTGNNNTSRINQNFQEIAEALNDQVLYRDSPEGEPNEMITDLDMNGKRLYNLARPYLDHEAARLQDVREQGGAPFSYFGPLPEDPLTRPDGSPLVPGDSYYNTTTNTVRYWNGGLWFTPNVDGQLLQTEDGATYIGWIQEGANKQATTVAKKLYQVKNLFDTLSDGQISQIKSYTPGVFVSTQLNQFISELSNAGGGKIILSAGYYSFNAPILMQSNVHVFCEEGVVIDGDASGDTAGIVKFTGVAGAEVALSAELNRGMTSISLVSPLSVQAGDLLHLMSQRNALGDDATPEWRLGFGTPGALVCYFSEFLIAKNTSNSTTVDLGSGPLFPKYRPDITEETQPSARTFAGLKVITPVQNAIWEGGQFINLEGKNTVFYTMWARDCWVKNSKIDKGISAGSAVFFINSFNCIAYRVKNSFDASLTYPEADHHKYNSFKTAGAQLCQFVEVHCEYGSQNVDFSYFDQGSPSIDCEVRESRLLFSRSNPITSHPGCYRITVLSNQCLYAQGNGISIRSRFGEVSHNTISGTQAATTDDYYGLACYAGWAVDNVLFNNTIEGFGIGMYEWDAGGDFDNAFLRSGNRWTYNTIRHCFDGGRTYVNQAHPRSQPRGTVFMHNNFSYISRSFFRTNEYTPGFIFNSNLLYGPHGAGQTAIFIAGNCPFSQIKDNHFLNLGTGNAINLGGVTDLAVFPQGQYSCEVAGNNFYGSTPTFNLSSNAWKPSYVEYNGVNYLSNSSTSPLAHPQYVALWNQTDDIYRIKWSDNTIKQISSKV